MLGPLICQGFKQGVRVGRHETDCGVFSLDIRELEIRDMSKLLQGFIEGKKLKGKEKLTLRMAIMGCAANIQRRMLTKLSPDFKNKNYNEGQSTFLPR